jgi:uncharacterized protein (DUF433 family)
MPPILGYAHLAKDPGYRGGAPRIAAHGLRVSGIVQMYRAGMTPEAISEAYQDLPLGAVFSALAYAADHPEEIEAEIAAEERNTAEAMKDYVFDPKLQAALERGEVLP